eukprot:CAMPEP_0168241582 /NCGR_PEP_ID=MMETSP0140_2-20121125/22875_1 /TAXON_ID=44445 /ORGANISM="Pseudo-nitzschia australis, Strain 10249 10 AB" /LENGTH=122 /DNA_ID=CAMNT_0008176449 /DNA_START=46 /DNA_END=414 /DNA_ORIENTATION=+
MVFSVAAATARRRIAVMATRQATQGQKRSMGGGPAVEWEGIDKVVRGVFPGDHQLAMAIMGGYTGLFLLFKMKSAITKKAPEEKIAAAPAASSTDGGVPSIESPEFGEWLGSNAFNAFLEKA